MNDITAGALVCSQPGFTNLSGTAAVAQLGSGTPSTATFLRGDGAWSSALTGGLTLGDDSTLTTSNGGFTVTEVHLDVKAKVPGASGEAFEKAASNAKSGCPISRLLNAKITMDARREA